MVKNKKGGKNHKKHKKQKGEGEYERELIFKDAEGQEYGQVVKLLGNCRFDCECFDGKNRLVHIRGKLVSKTKLTPGDVVLISLREFEDRKADMLLQYNVREVKTLKSLGEIPDSVKINERDPALDDEGEDIGIDFEEEGEKVEEEIKNENFEEIFENI
jgi:translation initiation factor 1A